MISDVLSQDEINSLLTDDDDVAEEVEKSHEKENLLTDFEKDALGEVANISMGSAATALYGLLGKKVDITTPRVELDTLGEIIDTYQRPCVVVDVQYVEGLKGSNQMILEEGDAAIITDLMMGGDGTAPPGELSELHISAVGEAMNQMMGSASTSMSDFFEGDKVNISPPKAELLEINSAAIHLEGIADDDLVVQVIFDIAIGDLIDSQLVQIMTIDFAKEMARGLIEQSTATTSSTEESKPQEQNTQQQQPTQQQPTQQQPMQQQPMQQQPMQQQPMQQQPMQQQPMQQQPMQNVEVQDVQFNQLGNSNTAGLNNDIRMIYDVALQLTVRLGKTEMSIKEVLDLGPGSVIELDRLAGEALDLLVNGKLVAKGEVVVIDENFGFRVTDIVSAEERVKKL